MQSYSTSVKFCSHLNWESVHELKELRKFWLKPSWPDFRWEICLVLAHLGLVQKILSAQFVLCFQNHFMCTTRVKKQGHDKVTARSRWAVSLPRRMLIDGMGGKTRSNCKVVAWSHKQFSPRAYHHAFFSPEKFQNEKTEAEVAIWKKKLTNKWQTQHGQTTDECQVVGR